MRGGADGIFSGATLNRIDDMKGLEMKIPPALLMAALALLMWLTPAIAPSLSFSHPWQSAVMWLFAIPGMLVTIAGFTAFRREGTTVDPTRPELASSLVVTGVYRFSRNPMYLGFLLVLTGWAIHIANLLAFAALPVFVAYLTRFQIIPEERALLTRFGDAYRAYLGSVRRWL